MRMDGDREAEYRRFHVFDLGPCRCAIGRAEDAVVVLHPEHVRIGRALNKAVHVLDVRIVGWLRWIVLGTQSMTGESPGLSTIASDPHAARRDADGDVLRIMWIDADRMNSRKLGAIGSPILSFRVIPQRAI